jgi:hypothetical protein
MSSAMIANVGAAARLSQSTARKAAARPLAERLASTTTTFFSAKEDIAFSSEKSTPRTSRDEIGPVLVGKIVDFARPPSALLFAAVNTPLPRCRYAALDTLGGTKAAN